MASESRSLFMALVTISQIFGVGSVVLMGIWLGKFQGGFGWGYKNAHKFNYHPLFMTIGLIFIYGDAIIAYRVFRNDSKRLVKILHAVMQFGALGFSSFALASVFSAHNEGGIANLYSIHSWLGLATFVMFALQFILGFVFFLTPVIAQPQKAAYMHHHRYWGVTVFCMAIATALMGIVENVGFKVQGYSGRTHEAYVINFLGLFLVIFGWFVTYIVTKPEYKRDASSADYQIQQDHD